MVTLRVQLASRHLHVTAVLTMQYDFQIAMSFSGNRLQNR